MNRAQAPGRFFALLMAGLAGPLLWALHLALVYLGQHVVCYTVAPAQAQTFLTWFISSVTVLWLLLLLIPLVQPAFFRQFVFARGLQSETGNFILWITKLMALLAIFAVFWQGVAVFFMADCAALR